MEFLKNLFQSLFNWIKSVSTLQAPRAFFSEMLTPGKGASTKRFVFLGGFFVVSYCVIKLSNAVAFAIRTQETIDAEGVAIYGILIGLYTTLVLVGYRKPDGRPSLSAASPDSPDSDDSEIKLPTKPHNKAK